jgi:hypothetical protein
MKKIAGFFKNIASTGVIPNANNSLNLVLIEV